jgi:hypothetical protein
MLVLRKRKATSDPDNNVPGGSMRRTLMGTLRGGHRDLQIVVASPRQDETVDELEGAVSTLPLSRLSS